MSKASSGSNGELLIEEEHVPRSKSQDKMIEIDDGGKIKDLESSFKEGSIDESTTAKLTTKTSQDEVTKNSKRKSDGVGKSQEDESKIEKVISDLKETFVKKRKEASDNRKEQSASSIQLHMKGSPLKETANEDGDEGFENELIARTSIEECNLQGSFANSSEAGIMVCPHNDNLQEIIARFSEEVKKYAAAGVIDPDGQEEDGQNEDIPDEEYFFPTPDEVENSKAPAIGMSFHSIDEAHRFVNVYGQLTGFAVVKGRNYKHRKIFLQCNKSRKPKQDDNPVKKRKRYTVEKTGCHMKATVTLKEGRWEITALDNTHNHALVCSPSLTKFFLQHRYMSDHERNLSRVLQQCRIKPRKIMMIFRQMSGNFAAMNFHKDDIVNLKQNDQRKRQVNTDIDRAITFLDKKQLEQPGFYYTMRREDDNTVKSLLWTDAKSRLDYSLYGDFISFDTTYSTNKYNMPFAPIVGINGHGKNIVFAWALLEDQKASTFNWLLSMFVEIMGGKIPAIIMTDQDAAMKKAIKDLFPTVIHRNCFWHLMRNARESLGAFMAARPGMEAQLDWLIYNSMTEQELEEGWMAMVAQHNAAGNSYLQNLYETRKQWHPVCLKNEFCPFIKSTGRSESTNSNFKDYVLRKDTIETFLQQYEIFEDEQEEIEKKDRFESTIMIPIYSTMQPIERDAGSIYTRGMYAKFQKELHRTGAYTVEEIVPNERYTLIKVMDYRDEEFNRNSYTVEVDRQNENFDCICSKMK